MNKVSQQLVQIFQAGWRVLCNFWQFCTPAFLSMLDPVIMWANVKLVVRSQIFVLNNKNKILDFILFFRIVNPRLCDGLSLDVYLEVFKFLILLFDKYLSWSPKLILHVNFQSHSSWRLYIKELHMGNDKETICDVPVNYSHTGSVYIMFVYKT